MDLSQLTDSELQQLSNVGNFAAIGELANRRNSIVRNLEIDPQGDIKTFNMSQDNLKSNIVEDNDLESQNAGEFQPEEKGIISLRDIVGDIVSKGAAGFKDIAGRSIASQALAGAGAMFNPYLAVAGGITGLLGGGDLFNSPYIGAGAATVDEYGNMYSAEQLDQMNARGGYYTDPARASRRRDKSIETFRARNAEVKGRYANLLAQQAKENTAKQSAFDKLNAIRQQNDSDSMSGGPGETTSGTFGSSVNDSSTFSDYS